MARVDKNRGRRLDISNPIIARSLIVFFPCFTHMNMNFSALNGQFLVHFMVAREIALLLWTGCQGTQKNNCYTNGPLYVTSSY